MQDSKKSEAKQRLFNEFNSGKVRILIGSSETMGTGVNVQTRLAALHHLDVPWLPSQIEQREGRIVRQGNQHEEVGLYAYATLGSLDATMWQNNERKARFIGAALSGDTSVRRLEDLGSGQANQFAMAKAIASGDPRLMQKAGLEAEIARLGRLHAAHVDDQHAIRRQIRDAAKEIELSTKRIDGIGKDLELLVPTQGDAFRIEVKGKTFTERKLAGRALMTEILTLVQLRQEEAQVIASIGGFDLEFEGKRVAREGFQYTTMLRRTGARYEVDLSMTVTPLGAISRLEHALSNFENERQDYRRRLIEAEKRLAAYQPRLGETFAFEGELELKRAELAEIETSLAASSDKPGNANVSSSGGRRADRSLVLLHTVNSLRDGLLYEHGRAGCRCPPLDLSEPRSQLMRWFSKRGKRSFTAPSGKTEMGPEVVRPLLTNKRESRHRSFDLKARNWQR